MNEKLKILLFPNDFNVSSDNALKAFAFSTTEKIFINKTDDFYHINYRFNDYLQLNLVKFAKILTSMFGKNMPGITFDLMVISEIDKNSRIAELHKVFVDNSNNINVINPKLKLVNTDEDDEDDEYNDETDDEFDPEDDEYNDADCEETVDTINQILGMGGGHGSASGKHKGHHKNNKTDEKYKKSYSSSRIFKETNHAKRDIKRHGIIIESSNKARDRDEGIIKSFLKDFIPGDSNWIKSYRKTILKRWINQYSITKKSAKKITKRNEEIMRSGNKKNNISVDRVSNATQNILKLYNPFYDSSK